MLRSYSIETLRLHCGEGGEGGRVSRAHTKGTLLLTREIAETIQFALSSVAAICLHAVFLWPAVSAFGPSRVTASVEKNETFHPSTGSNHLHTTGWGSLLRGVGELSGDVGVGGSPGSGRRPGQWS